MNPLLNELHPYPFEKLRSLKEGCTPPNIPHIALSIGEPKHEAPELYINLTNGTEWRFGNSGWQFQEPGSIIYNEPFKEHAMRVNENPFLSIWCWPKNSSSECILVPRSDWSNLK